MTHIRIEPQWIGLGAALLLLLALGFFGFAYYEENKDALKLVPIDDGIADSGRSGVDAPSSGTPATLSMRTVCTSIAQYSADDVRLTSVIQEGPGDREAMAWVATTQGIKSEDVRDLMVASVESRFGQVNRLPRAIEWLSDNGSGYIAKDTKRFARDLGFEPLTTPVVGRGVADRLLPPQAAEMSC